MLWGLDSEGNFISSTKASWAITKLFQNKVTHVPSSTTSSTPAPSLTSVVPISGPNTKTDSDAITSKTAELIQKDISRVRSALIDELEKLNSNSSSSLNANEYLHNRLLYLFQKDLLPGIKALILEAKNARDTARPGVVSKKIKWMCWIFLLVINSGMLSYITLFAVNQTEQRQYSWFCTFLVWFAMDVLLVSTMIVFITHFVIPFTIMI